MKRNVIDVIRRGLDDALANWPLILLRVGEVLVLLVLTVAAVFLILAPIAVSIGVSLFKLRSPDEVESALLVLGERWGLAAWVLIGVFLALGVVVAVHSFVEAGCARVLVDGERKAGPPNEGPRARYRTFSVQRWWAGAASGWWTIFWIYNFAWGLMGLIVLLPVIPAALLIYAFRETPEAVAGVSCFGIVAVLATFFVVAIATNLWTSRAIVDWAATPGDGAWQLLRTAWRSVRADFARHILVAGAMMLIAMAGSSFLSGLSFFAAFGEAFDRQGVFSLVTLPIRVLTSLASMAFSSAVTNWYVAAFAAIALETTQDKTQHAPTAAAS